MKFSQYLIEKKWIDKTMIGYKISFSDIQNISNSIKKELDKNNILYNQNKDFHVTVAQIYGKYPKDEIVRKIQDLPSNFTMKPKKLKLLWGKNVKKWFITIEYKRNDEYIKSFDMIKENFPKVVIFENGMIPHISLFTIPGNISLDIWKEIEEKYTQLPTIKIKDIELFNKNFQVEFDFKKV
jgi:hypothetical protein